MDYREKLSRLGVIVPRIILPKEGTDLSRYAVLSCDQYVERPEYWKRVREYVGDSPSTLNMILPEAFMLAGDKNYDRRCRYMDKYLSDGTLEDIGEAMVFTVRKTAHGTRRGLIVAFDLEEYSSEPGGDNLIRVTERTDASRVDARLQIRKNAQLEFPHILMLLVDKSDRLMNMLLCENENMKQLYDFDLFEDAGHITGYKIDDDRILGRIADTLETIYEENGSCYSFAVGDGNHSIMTAKAHWEEIKKNLTPEEAMNHPARYVLGEIVNLYDKAIPYDCMNRLLTDVEDTDKAIEEMGIDMENLPDLQTLQPILDAWLENNPDAKLEYVHDADTCERLGKKKGSIAFCYHTFDREIVAEKIRRNETFVRKSFAMGFPSEKRFYLEGRRIK